MSAQFLTILSGFVLLIVLALAGGRWRRRKGHEAQGVDHDTRREE